jgi:long-chain acyl-CoA synthetase
LTSLFDLYRPAFETLADRTAVVCGDARLTYAELGAKVSSLAAALQKSGLAPGAKVALLFPSEPESVVAFLAVQQIGAVACPVNIESTEGELTQLLELIDADVVLVSDAATETRQMVERVWDGPVASYAEAGAGALSRSIVSRQPDAELADVAIVLCTSGTTGLPKAAMLTHDNLVKNLAAFRDHLRSFPGCDWQPVEAFGNPIPLSHPYGLIMMTLMPLFMGGATVLIPRFSPAAALEAIEQHRITFFGGVPSMFAMLNRYRRKGDYDVSSCRIWITGGAPLPRSVDEEFPQQFGVRICEGFGMLETTSLASLNFESPLRHPGSCGPFHARMRAEIRDEDGRVLPTGEVGELWIAGPNVMKGYYRNQAATDDALHNGWLKTGDLGLLDEDGHLYLKGRTKEIMIVGGHNVHPREVENVLMTHPGVADAAVAAENDEVRGERILAFVVQADGADADEQALLQHCRANLSPYKAPRAIHFVPLIHRNAAGKIMRRQLIDDLKSASASAPTPIGSAV